MFFLTILQLIFLAMLGALVTFLFLRLWRHLNKPALQSQQRGVQFQEAEEKVRFLKSSQKLTDTASTLEHLARDLAGAEISEQLKKFRDTREKAARAQAAMGASGEGFEGSLVIPKVFRDPDPDVGLARIFYDLGAKSVGLNLEMKVAAASCALAWLIFLMALILWIAG